MKKATFLDEHNMPVESSDEIQSVLDEITDCLAAMTKAQRIDWFRRTQYPHPINFNAEIDGMVYTVKTHFKPSANESLYEKAERLILKSSKQFSN